MNKLSHQEIKNLELNILVYIDSICKENNIKYHLSYGTLLGAIRHKGFIPWDDDIDICMLREDYKKFLELLSKDNDSRFKLFSFENKKDYFYEFAKVVDTKTTVIETNVRKCEGIGLWVDIFPLDEIPSFHKLQRKLVKILVAFRILSVYIKFPVGHNKFEYPLWLFAKIIGPKFFLKCSKWLCLLGNNKGNLFVGYVPSFRNKNFFFKKEIVENLCLVEFEDKKFPAPYDYNDYLTHLYGPNYMTPPPVEKRLSHPMEAYLN